MSKGSGSRPFSVPPEEFSVNHERIFGKKVRQQYVPPPLPDRWEISETPKVKLSNHKQPHEAEMMIVVGLSGTKWVKNPLYKKGKQ